MLLDDVMPCFDFSERHEIHIQAGVEEIWHALHELSVDEVKLFRTFIALRYLPARLIGGSPLQLANAAVILDEFIRAGFVHLGEHRPSEFVIGAVGKFWRITSAIEGLSSEDDFRHFAKAGYAKTAVNFTLEVDGNFCVARTETRVQTFGPLAKARFGAYWVPVRLGGGLLRRTLLRALKRRAEA